MAVGSKHGDGESNLQTNVETWLREQGYPLEMRTAQAFSRRGWFLHHSRRYKDPTTEKEREIDLLAFDDDPVTISPIHCHLVIECKWTPMKPWVLFTAARKSLTPIGHFCSTPMTRSATSAVECLASEDVAGFSLFSELEEAYALVQAFRKGDSIDAAYAAVQSAVNAADFFARSMSESTEHAIVYVPIVILDGDLFRCSLSKSGEATVYPVDAGCLIHNTANEFSKCVHIVRETALEEFIDRAEKTFKSLRISLQRKRNPNSPSRRVPSANKKSGKHTGAPSPAPQADG